MCELREREDGRSVRADLVGLGEGWVRGEEGAGGQVNAGPVVGRDAEKRLGLGTARHSGNVARQSGAVRTSGWWQVTSQSQVGGASQSGAGAKDGTRFGRLARWRRRRGARLGGHRAEGPLRPAAGRPSPSTWSGRAGTERSVSPAQSRCREGPGWCHPGRRRRGAGGRAHGASPWSGRGSFFVLLRGGGCLLPAWSAPPGREDSGPGRDVV